MLERTCTRQEENNLRKTSLLGGVCFGKGPWGSHAPGGRGGEVAGQREISFVGLGGYLIWVVYLPGLKVVVDK